VIQVKEAWNFCQLLKFGLILLVIACSTGKKEIGSAKSVISSANDYGMLQCQITERGFAIAAIEWLDCGELFVEIPYK
jgi:hypothetical protein